MNEFHNTACVMPDPFFFFFITTIFAFAGLCLSVEKPIQISKIRNYFNVFDFSTHPKLEK